MESSLGPRRRNAFDRAGIILLLFYLLAGVIYSAILAPTARFPDEADYLTLSYNLLHGPGFSLDSVHLTAGRPPGYIFFLAGLRAMGGGFLLMRVAQFCLLGATLLLLSRLCSERKADAGLLIVTAVAICYPVLFYTSATLYPQTLAGFLFVASLALVLIANRTLGVNMATGLTFGALILTVPTFLLTMGVLLGVAGLLRMLRWRDVLLMILAAGFVVGIWSVRNAARFHRFVPIASNSGLNLLMGNNARAVAEEGVANTGANGYEAQAERLGLDEFQSDHFFTQAAMAWITAHPGDALILYLEKSLNFFNFTNVYAPQSHQEVSPAKQAVMAASYLLLLALLAWRLAEVKRFPLLPREKLFLLVYVLSAFTSAIFTTRIRYRIPYDYLIIAVIALHLSRHLESWLGSGARKLPQSGS